MPPIATSHRRPRIRGRRSAPDLALTFQCTDSGDAVLNVSRPALEALGRLDGASSRCLSRPGQTRRPSHLTRRTSDATVVPRSWTKPNESNSRRRSAGNACQGNTRAYCTCMRTSEDGLLPQGLPGRQPNCLSHPRRVTSSSATPHEQYRQRSAPPSSPIISAAAPV